VLDCLWLGSSRLDRHFSICIGSVELSSAPLARPSSAPLGPARLRLGLAQVRPSSDQLGLFSSAGSISARLGATGLGLAWPGSDWLGPARLGSSRPDPTFSAIYSPGHVNYRTQRDSATYIYIYIDECFLSTACPTQSQGWDSFLSLFPSCFCLAGFIQLPCK
jgi:hypothetical protein